MYLSLDSLSEGAVNDLLQELTTWTGDDPSFGALIHRETAGNPLFVVEAVASLRDEGRLPGSAEGWLRAAGEISDHLDNVTRLRLELRYLARLDEDEQLRALLFVEPLAAAQRLRELCPPPSDSMPAPPPDEVVLSPAMLLDDDLDRSD